MLELGKGDQTVRSSSFEGLGEKQLNTIYRLAIPRTLEKGETLFREGETDQMLYVVLEGEIRVVRNLQQQPETISIMHQGAWLGEFGFTGKMPRTETAFAGKPSRVLAIDKAVVDALDEKTQLPLFKRLCLLGSLRNRDHTLREQKLAVKNRQLIEALYSTRTKGKLDYTSSQMVQSIVNKVPKLPAFASTLGSKLLLEGTSLKQFSETIKADPALVGVVMKTINSTFYGFYKKISDVHRAVVLLGANEIYRLVMGAGVRRTMPDTPYFRSLHYHSLAISYIASVLCQKAQHGNAAQIATIGLLHDLGNIVAKLLIEKYPAVEMLIDAQHRAHMGALLLKRWNLPDVVSQSVAFQYYPEFTPPAKIPPEIRINVALLYMSHLCYDIFQGDSGHDLATAFLDEYLSLVNWGKLSVADIAQKHVLPDLIKKRQSFPVFFREMLEKNLQTGGHDTQEGSHEKPGFDIP
jgi:HD-like signal output (HDOD) protein/CRP-like cAMP-binding protein